MNHLRTQLARTLAPRTIAVVGANEQLGMSNNAVRPMIEAGLDVVLVNPNRDELYGQPAFANLSAYGQPVDAVLSLVNAERSIDVLDEAGALGCGGVVVAAAGFDEAGAAGRSLQERLISVARDRGLAVIGPNCSGFKHVPSGVNLFTGGRLELPAGGLAVVSQSGFLVRSALAAAAERRLGVSIAVSSGNEAVCDLADHLAVLASDPGTRVICLVIETVRRPGAFFDAVAQARAADKPVIALKLGRTDRARSIMKSHTGAIADASWVYDLAFSEHGIIAARDIDDLMDRSQLLAQIPAAGRRSIQRIGMITTSGGVAALATDLAAELDAPLPPLAELEPWVRERVPGDTVNPLDLTGFVMSKPDLMVEVFDTYAKAVDILSLVWWTGDGDEGWATTLLSPFAAAAAANPDVPFVVTPLEATGTGPWVDGWCDKGLYFTRGVESMYRAVEASNRFSTVAVRGTPAPIAAPDVTIRPRTIATDAGLILTFTDAMEFLQQAGISVAPWLVLEAGTDHTALAALGDRLVVKLADVPHRTELGAVRLGVTPDAVAEAAAQLRAIAVRHGVADRVVVQAMVSGIGEAFAGLQCRSDLGSVALFGHGGVLVEVGGRMGGRFCPLDPGTIDALADEVAGPAVFARLRGQSQWNLDAVRSTLGALDRLWRTHRGWLDSLDLNPLIVTEDSLVAVDALFVVREDDTK